MKLREILNKRSNCYRPAPDKASASDAALTASFVVPIYNSATTIGQCVRSIVNQQRADLIKEIVLVNDGSTDGSVNEMTHIAALYPQVKIIIKDNGTRKYAAYARNRGVEVVEADLVCFIDSDIILPPNYLHQHILQHQADDRCITFSLRSNISRAELATFPVQADETDFRHKLLGGNGTLQGEGFNFCSTHTIAELCLTCAVTYRRDDLIKVKGCPENFKGWGFNDTAMAAKVIALGRSAVPLYGATVAHIEHAPRSGATAAKWAEFAKNKSRYNLMLDLPAENTFNFYLEALEI